MAEQWISARDAHALVTSRDTILKRAHAGLIRAKARLIIVHDEQWELSDLPAEFWSGHEKLELTGDWSVGDFSTMSDIRPRRQSFGVTFALSDVLAMLPAETRGLAAQRFSIVGDAGWLSASDAIRLATARALISPDAAMATIVEKARLGFIGARAVEMTPIDSAGNPIPDLDGEREWDVPREFWIDCTPTDWTLGAFAGKTNANGTQAAIALIGVHFRRDALQRAIPPTPSTAEAPPPAKAEAPSKPVGGRPPAAFNDDLMCAIWERIFRGELIPKTKADIKNAILDWASTHGHELSETTAKEKARKIFDAFKREGENS